MIFGSIFTQIILFSDELQKLSIFSLKLKKIVNGNIESSRKYSICRNGNFKINSLFNKHVISVVLFDMNYIIFGSVEKNVNLKI
jgi:hypothetical protein